MSEQVGAGGKINEEGYSRHLYELLTSGVGTRTSTAWKVIQRGAGANMSVDVQQGDGLISISSEYVYPAWVASSDKNVSVDAADGSNPRIDRVVAYISLSDISTAVTNNTGALKFKVVAGTPAGSPTAPNDATVQSSIGASNPWIEIARVAVAAGATSISNANITDRRTAMAVRAPIQKALTTKSASFTIAVTEDVTPVSASGGAVTATLPDATLMTGREFTVEKTDSSANVVTVATTSSQTINGSTNDYLSSQYDSVTYRSNGTNWTIAHERRNPRIGYAQRTTNYSGSSVLSAVTSLSASVYVPAGKIVKVRHFAETHQNGNNQSTQTSLWRGTVGSGSEFARAIALNSTAAYQNQANPEGYDNPGAGNFTYNVGIIGSAGTPIVVATTEAPAFIEVLAR